MKICQLCAVDFTLYHFLLPLMRGLRAHGHEVVGVCADGPLLDRVRAEGFRVETVPFERRLNPFVHFAAFIRLLALLKRERFELVHVHTPVAALIGRFAARIAGTPRIVYTAHGFYFHDDMAHWKRGLFVALEWIGGRVTDVLLTQSAEDAAAARRLRLCRTGHVEAIGNGTDPALFHPDGPAEGDRGRQRAALGTPADRIVIVTVGRLVLEKGYAELFEAMCEVEAELWVIGERLSSDHAATIDALLESVAADPTLGPRIRLLGRRDDVAALLRAADLFVLASHREGMPRSIIEAMMTGLPVVATDIRGAREEVIDGETGLLVPKGDAAALRGALRRLAGDPELRARLGAAGRCRALRKYDETSVIDRQIDALSLRTNTRKSIST